MVEIMGEGIHSALADVRVRLQVELWIEETAFCDGGGDFTSTSMAPQLPGQRPKKTQRIARNHSQERKSCRQGAQRFAHAPSEGTSHPTELRGPPEQCLFTELESPATGVRLQ